MERSTETSSSNGAVSRQAAGAANLQSGSDTASHLTGENIRTSAIQATDKVISGATKAAESLCEQGRKLKEGKMHIGESCRTHMREKPLSSLGIAVAAGFVLALIFKRK
jgi:ElaB/YqjD/DUF883 family membrane-anchored ribosome-binding protein